MTFFYKQVFPVVWFGINALLIAMSFVVPLIGPAIFDLDINLDIGFLLVPAIMMIVGYIMMKKLLFDLVDEVLDAGDALVVRNGDREERVALSDIMNVGYSPYMNPPRVTLSLRNPGIFGDKVSFCAPVSFMPFSASPIIDELIKRIDAARRGGPAAGSGHRR